MGLRWRNIPASPTTTWDDIYAILTSKRADNSILRPIQEGWTHDELIGAAIFDALQVSNWQRAGDAHAPYPKPLPRPGVDSASAGAKRYATGMGTREEFENWAP